jgi:hypothetical protein
MYNMLVCEVEFLFGFHLDLLVWFQILIGVQI